MNRVVPDASALVALLADAGPAGVFATERLTGVDLLVPNLAVVETANILRRHELAGLISADQAVQAHEDLLDLVIDLWPYELVAGRVWELRHRLTSYDASYVAVAELTESTLVTLDRRMAGAPGLRCEVAAPP